MRGGWSRRPSFASIGLEKQRRAASEGNPGQSKLIVFILVWGSAFTNVIMLFMARRCATILSRRGVSYLPKKLNYYEILGVKSNASLEEIKAAFAKKSAELHPDRKSKTQDSRVGWSRSSDTELFMEVKEAYDCLRNPKKRAAYDDQIVSSNGYLKEV
ncbi:hypothetical protein KIN20_009232 [Parelaphostrongylus tenuis]|uniref:J domain-containing protein n=1 Tax=Parelaphostrongylus tenuis TaxID=148309 RepID=A0AAD5QKK6_PARTN|nr:hypothetical protein KIN20_009232 [Parelaphostrongylus tenuis]